MYRRVTRFSTQRALRSSVPPPSARPALPARQTHRFRNFVWGSTAAISLAYAAGVYLSLDNDGVYEVFTYYAPFGTTVVSLAEDQRLRHLSVPSGTSFPRHPTAADIARKQEPRAVVSAGGAVPTKVSETPAPAPARDPAPVPAPTHTHDSSPTSDSLPHITVPSDLDPALAGVVDTLNEWIASSNKAKVTEHDIRNMVATLKKVSANVHQLRVDESAATEQKLQDQATRFAAVMDAHIQDLVADFDAHKKHMLEVYNERLDTEVEATRRAVVAEANNRLQSQYNDLTNQFATQIAAMVDGEREGRLSGLSDLSNELTALKKTVASTGSAIKGNDAVVDYFVALGNLQNILSGEAEPLRQPLDDVKKSLSHDPLVTAALSAVSEDVLDHGVLSQSQLAARFALIEPEIRRASLAPSNSGIAGHLTSWLFSHLLVKKTGMPVGDDIESVLARTQTLLSQGKVVDAVAEVNTLQGWPREIASDWLREGRKRGEVEFILNTLLEEGRLSSISQQ